MLKTSNGENTKMTIEAKYLQKYKLLNDWKSLPEYAEGAERFD